MKKVERQQLIRKIIAKSQIERQDDLVAALKGKNVYATQATISRDIKELQLVKVPANDGGYRYALPAQGEIDNQTRLSTELSNNMISLKRQEQFLSIIMHPGNGPVMASLIRQLEIDGVFSVIGDDAGVLIVCRSIDAAINVEKMFWNLMN
ncbi:arginine repressor [Limosilactobacillus fastidiosus]|uniref:Arginine repressor n=1 Tax=Limosilactobacillus fastidiosus TaxID=2759855 RepID=A0A7W3U0L6_9LACO|nr:ArgR family transcriptional regulator [Limosilactobacillus fastidiosus]MBB1063743.1 ArgR family transcriptional regulator [Limosilactobacillus fastidiosus]MBB1086728.1 ArgR family transcriptional regulator [Limosilactobacillus fastidiosus]MCD7084318.1 ArgR family transcriptional regulator [Limosilactobacillus fastidiosus]MCD7085545.1 ArgR family transcriptional regulator [Limosilactobacillus fastidiosus]MCD7114776.1 ArgR family transcriptional regulator [Limosilactobacillus fastidiosus]